MNISIDAAQRRTLWADLVADLAAIDSVYRAITDGAWASAQALRCRFEHDMRLLDDIGWAEHQPGERFDLTTTAGELQATLRHLHDRVNRRAHDLLADTQSALRDIDVYAGLLGQVRDERDDHDPARGMPR